MADYSIKAGDVVLIPDKSADEVKSVWDVVWTIKERRDEKRYVGKLWFKGEPDRGVVDMDFEIEPKFREKEYTRDALRSIVEWVFMKRDLYEIKITVNVEDEEKIDAIERSGFVFRMGNKLAESYSIVKPKTTWMGLYIIIGVIVGLPLGILIDSMIAGLAIGLLAGIAMGAIMDGRANSERYRVTGEKKTVHRKAVFEIEEEKEEAEESEEQATND